MANAFVHLLACVCAAHGWPTFGRMGAVSLLRPSFCLPRLLSCVGAVGIHKVFGVGDQGHGGFLLVSADR
jgi:hypothetical protein